jgi:glycerophosphoryl diester phosphodiesterase
MKLAARTILVESLRDLRRTWPQLILTDLLARVLAVVVLTPLVGLLFKVFLATTATGVVTDGAIVGFLLHPTGLAALLVVCTVSLGILFVETGQLMVIGFASIEDRRASWVDAYKHVFRRLLSLIHLAWHAVIRMLLMALPFLVALGALYWFLLRSYDINYYLTEKPPEFLVAVVIGGLLLTVMAVWIIVRIADWLLALPMVLFEKMGGRRAMVASQEVTAVHRWKIVLWLVEWILAVVLLSVSAGFVVGRIGDVLISPLSSNLILLLVGVCAVLVVSGLASLAVTVFTTVLFPLLMVRLYRFVAGPGELRPEISAPGTLGEKASWRIPGKTFLLAAAVALLMVAVGTYLTMRHLDGSEHAQIIAHRGGAGVAPENTMAAFRRGIEDGADWLELDVQENADGVVVIGHDRDFMRVAGLNLDVWKATDADLADLDVGSFFDPTFSDQRVPTLGEVLELAKDRAGVFIELKYYGHDRNLEAKVVGLVEATKMVSDIVIMSLEYDGVKKTAELRPTWTYGLLNAVAIGDLTHLDVDFLALTAKAASYGMIRRAHKRGMKVYVWTVDDPVQMSVMMSRGVDGIITDQVALARQVKDLREKLTPFGRFVFWLAGESGLLGGMEKSSARDDA